MVPFSWSCSTAVRKILLISSETFLHALSFLVLAALLDSIWARREDSSEDGLGRWLFMLTCADTQYERQRWQYVGWTHRVLVVLKHLGFGFEVVCGWHRVFVPAVPLFQNVCVQPRLHGCIQDHLKLCWFYLPRHSDASVLFSHQTLKCRKQGRNLREKESEREREEMSIIIIFQGSTFWLSSAGWGVDDECHVAASGPPVVETRTGFQTWRKIQSSVAVLRYLNHSLHKCIVSCQKRLICSAAYTAHVWMTCLYVNQTALAKCLNVQ